MLIPPSPSNFRAHYSVFDHNSDRILRLMKTGETMFKLVTTSPTWREFHQKLHFPVNRKPKQRPNTFSYSCM